MIKKVISEGEVDKEQVDLLYLHIVKLLNQGIVISKYRKALRFISVKNYLFVKEQDVMDESIEEFFTLFLEMDRPLSIGNISLIKEIDTTSTDTILTDSSLLLVKQSLEIQIEQILKNDVFLKGRRLTYTANIEDSLEYIGGSDYEILYVLELNIYQR